MDAWEMCSRCVHHSYCLGAFVKDCWCGNFLERRKGTMICPSCKKSFDRLLALSRKDNKTMICDLCGTKDALDSAGLIEGSSVRENILKEVAENRGSRKSPYERTRDKVVATGNRWAIENFNATHN